MSMEIARQCVARGAALLDEHIPGWRECLNPGMLDMGSPNFCVLGQLYGPMDGYARGIRALGIVRLGGSQHYGFNAGYFWAAEAYTSFGELHEAWLEQISQAR